METGQPFLSDTTKMAEDEDIVEAPTDGRRQRSERSKHKIAAAMIDLIMEGDMAPSAEAVAERAKVGLRSVFRHFKDMDSLFHEVSRIMHAQYIPQTLVIDSDRDWYDQLLEMIELRCSIFDKVTPIQQSMLAQKHRSKFIQQEITRNNALLRDTFTVVLPSGIKANAETVEALDAVLSPATWMRLRLDQGLPRAKARKIIENMVAALVKPD